MFNSVINFIQNFIWKYKSRNINKNGNHYNVELGCKIVGGSYISIGDNFVAKKDLRLQAWKEYKGNIQKYDPELHIGNDVSMMRNCQISCLSKVAIGNGCLLGDNVFITDNSHGKNSFEEMSMPPALRNLFSKGPVIIGDNVWLGRNVCVLPGVKIGNGAVIGANSVVTHDVQENTIVAGVPARIIKNIGR